MFRPMAFIVLCGLAFLVAAENQLANDTSIRKIQEHGVINYRFGNRHYSDRPIAFRSDRFRYPRPHTVLVNVTYPVDDEQFHISYVDLHIEQTNDLSKAYITQGGIGQTFINIVIEAYHVTDISYEVEFFTHD